MASKNGSRAQRANSLAGPGFGRSLLNCMMAGPVEDTITRFRAAAALPPDSQKVIDDAVIRVSRNRLVIVNDLIEEGLTRDLPNWISVMQLGYRRSNDVGHAQRTMIPKARGERQVADMDEVVIPIFCTWDDFSFHIRELAMAERVGQPLDTTHTEMATRRVNEAIEDQGINGAGFAVNGVTAPGFLTSPANTQAYVDNEAWDVVGHTGDDIYRDVVNMISTLQGQNFNGPYNLYIPPTYGLKLGEDFKANGSLTIRQRLEELEFGGRGIRIRVADRLPANRTLLLQMTSDVVDVIMGQTPTTISWEDGPGWERFFSVLACVVVRIKENYDEQQGYVVGNTTA